MASLEALVRRNNWRKYKYKDCLNFVAQEFPRFLEVARGYNPRIMSTTNPKTQSIESAYATDRDMHFYIELEYPNKGDRYIIDPITKPRELLHVGPLRSCRTGLKIRYQRAVYARETVYWPAIKAGVRHEHGVDLDDLINPKPIKFAQSTDEETLRLVGKKCWIDEVNTSVVLSAIAPEFKAQWEDESKRPYFLMSLLEQVLPQDMLKKLATLEEVSYRLDTVKELTSNPNHPLYSRITNLREAKLQVNRLVDKLNKGGFFNPSQSMVEYFAQMLELAYLGVRIHGDGKIIDAGSGVGVIALTASQLRGCQAVAIDREKLLIRYGREFDRKHGSSDVKWHTMPFEEFDDVDENDTIIAYRPECIDNYVVQLTLRRGNNLVLFPSQINRSEDQIPEWENTLQRIVYFKQLLQRAGRNAYLFLSGDPYNHIKGNTKLEQMQGELPKEMLQQVPDFESNYTLVVTKQRLDIPNTNLGLSPEQMIPLDQPISR